MGCVILLWHTLSHPYNYFGFEDGTLVLIVSVPGHCLPLTFFKRDDPLTSLKVIMRTEQKLNVLNKFRN